MQNLKEDFLTSSSIHGFSQMTKYLQNHKISCLIFFVRTRSTIQFLIWFALTIAGFVLTCVTTYLCYDVRHILHSVVFHTLSKDWADTPTSTSVAQIPIESVVFPAVTLCAITDTAEDLSLQHVLGECSFTKNNQDTGDVCERVQVSFNASFVSAFFSFYNRKSSMNLANVLHLTT